MTDVTDMSKVIEPKSDQINADDLIAGPRTITITQMTVRPGTEQPVAVSFDGSGGKVYRPCKSMARVMVAAWGPDAKKYVGHSMTLYRDPKVKWGGMEVGGIRISHMTGIERDLTMALTETKGKKAQHRVLPLKPEAAPTQPAAAQAKQTIGEWLDALEAELTAAQTGAEVDAIASRDRVRAALGSLKNGALARLNAMLKAALDRVTPDDGALPEDDGWPGPATEAV